MNELNHIPNNESFDPSENLLFALVDGKVFHRVYLSAQYAEDLWENGKVQIESIGLIGNPRIVGGDLVY